MKIILLRPVLIAALLITSLISAKAQTVASTRADSLQRSYATKRAQSFYFEALGPGGPYSVNYDTRFNKRQDGLGGRIGLSYYAEDGDHLFTVPLVFNYLLGKQGKYFEVGAGITYYVVSSNVFFFKTTNYGEYPYYYTENTNDNGVIGTLNFGYRYQPVDGGFTFRAGVSPVFSSHEFIPYWPYVSFGYSF